MKKITFALLISCFLLSGCRPQTETERVLSRTAVLPPGGVVEKILDDSWFIAKIDGNRYLVKYNLTTNGHPVYTFTQITNKKD